jgi:large subunit ribosomal protein L29
MDSADIRKLSLEEIEQELEGAHEELWRLRFRAATEQLENPVLIRDRRRDVARMLTILKEHRDPNHLTVLPSREEGSAS